MSFVFSLFLCLFGFTLLAFLDVPSVDLTDDPTIIRFSPVLMIPCCCLVNYYLFAVFTFVNHYFEISFDCYFV